MRRSDSRKSPVAAAGTANEARVLLTDIRMDGVGFSTASLRPPFCVSGLTGPLSLCYVIRGGPIWLQVEAAQRQILNVEPGSVVGLSGIVPHWFKTASDLPTLAATPLSCAPLSASTEFHGPINLLIGHVPLETLAFTNTLSGAVVVPPAGGRVARRIKQAIEAIEDELKDPDPTGGTSAVVRRHSEIILMNFARWVTASEADANLPLGAMGDVRIMRAVAAAAQAPLETWTVRRMAEVAGMSRTAFARRFQLLTGDTPLHMLAHLRLRMAAEALSQGSGNLDDIAAIAGYGSAAAFSRAFRKYYQTTPAQWRAARVQPAR